MKELWKMTKFLKTTLTLILLTFSMQLFALTDAEEIEFAGAVNEGKLSIVKKYIEILGGTINFKSNENFGSTFYLKLPEN